MTANQTATGPAQPPFGPPDYPGEQYHPAQPPQKKSLPVWAKVVTVAVGCFTLLGVIGLLTGNSGTSAPPAAVPATSAPATQAPADPATQAPVTQTASGVLESDGYTVAMVESQSDIDSTFGAAAPYVADAASGYQGDQIEVVMVMNAEGTTLAATPGFQDGLRGALPSGVTVTVDGSVIRAAGPASAFGGRRQTERTKHREASAANRRADESQTGGDPTS